MKHYLIPILIGTILFFISLLSGCAKYIVHKPSCGIDPIMRKIEIVDGCISGKDLQYLKDNHIDLWTRIEELKIKGCK